MREAEIIMKATEPRYMIQRWDRKDRIWRRLASFFTLDDYEIADFYPIAKKVYGDVCDRQESTWKKPGDCLRYVFRLVELRRGDEEEDFEFNVRLCQEGRYFDGRWVDEKTLMGDMEEEE